MIKKLFIFLLLAVVLTTCALLVWRHQPINALHGATDFTVESGSSVRASIEQINAVGIDVSPLLMEFLARVTGKGNKIKAGHYNFKLGTTPIQLIDQLVRGEFAQEALVIIEGSTFADMRRAIAAHPHLKHDTAALPDSALLAKLDPDLRAGEGMFFPDTYRFARNASDLHIYRQAYSMMQKKLAQHWQQRAADLPYKSPYEALVMASIIEKETAQPAERSQIASVFVNRLARGMLLQTDPTVIYGMGARYKGNIRKTDLLADTPYNTYKRAGLPPTPISLPGEKSLQAALNPEKSAALYFVSRGDGTSHFSDNLAEHNRAVNKYQR